ncbi:Alpha/Beta hydrolase protein [Powellomyces hirtus]|nr:Alpha/Beta hydrolase protein [Powellomyces hirtus]
MMVNDCKKTVSAVALGLAAACLIGGAPGVNASVIRRDLSPFNWTSCNEKLLCGEFSVPLDHSNPLGEKINIATIKIPARTQPSVGTIFVNPGGPSSSGIAMVLSGSLQPVLFGDRHDVIAIDPRGIGRSSPIECFPDGTTSRLFRAGLPMDPAESFELASAKMQLLAKTCVKNAAKILPHMTTAAVARDFEAMRVAVGGPFNYVGYSYGTHIGLTYNNMFPDNVGRVVLDGIQDPEAWTEGNGFWFTPNTTEVLHAKHVQENLERFASACEEAGPERCVLANAAAKRPYVLPGIMKLYESLKAAPIVVEDADVPDVFTHVKLATLLKQLVYKPAQWPTFAQVLGLLFRRNALVAQNLMEKKPAEPFPARDQMHQEEAMFSVTCSDGAEQPYDAAKLKTEAQLMVQKYPFGASNLNLIKLACAFWPKNIAKERYTGPWNKKTNGSVLLVSNLHDPVTPIESAERVHAMLPGSSLVRVDSYGHTSNAQVSKCANEIIRRFLIDGLGPETKVTDCTVDDVLFPPKRA